MPLPLPLLLPALPTLAIPVMLLLPQPVPLHTLALERTYLITMLLHRPPPPRTQAPTVRVCQRRFCRTSFGPTPSLLEL